MDVQICSNGFELKPGDPDISYVQLTAVCDKLQRDFQSRYCGWGYTLDLYGVVHQLDMASQEVSEAWDMVEGGWKHHKKNPAPVDRGELLMELVDVIHFLINAEMFSPDAGSPSYSEWYYVDIADHSKFDHSEGAHSTEPWVGLVATKLNILRTGIVIAAMGYRSGYDDKTVLADLTRFAVETATSIPGVNIGTVLEAFKHKNAINVKRQNSNY